MDGQALRAECCPFPVPGTRVGASEISKTGRAPAGRVVGMNAGIVTRSRGLRLILGGLVLITGGLVAAQTPAGDTGPAKDVAAIHQLEQEYTHAVDTVDLDLLGRIWSHAPEVSFIYPLGEERGYDAIAQNVFTKVMGGMFSARDLQLHDVSVHVNGKSAWAEFGWVFHATMRTNGAAVTTRGVETQIYRKEEGQWRLVHVHYSEDRGRGSE
jgi:ketosteroid isomerase-like protein